MKSIIDFLKATKFLLTATIENYYSYITKFTNIQYIFAISKTFLIY